jgi:hypothetical protein
LFSVACWVRFAKQKNLDDARAGPSLPRLRGGPIVFNSLLGSFCRFHFFQAFPFVWNHAILVGAGGRGRHYSSR